MPKITEGDLSFINFKDDQVGKNWKCGYCSENSRLKDDDIFQSQDTLSCYENKSTYFTLIAIQCRNENCKKLTLNLKINHASDSLNNGDLDIKSPYLNCFRKEWSLLPESSYIFLPEYVPDHVREDYEEACKVANLSPKASAVLSRRCIQSIIRDFYGVNVKSNKLDDEIKAISDSEITAEMRKAFHSLRNIGNKGAHAEVDVNRLISISPEEAVELTCFIENIIKLTYIEKHEHEKNLAKINSISKSKNPKSKSK